MSLKSDILALLAAKKDEKVAAVVAEFDALLAQITDLPEDAPADAVLAQKVLELEAKVLELVDKEGKLQAKLDAVKAALEA